MRSCNAAPRQLVPPFLLALATGACELDWEALEDQLLVATATVVLTADPADSSWVRTDAMLVLTDSSDTPVPGASVRIVGESGRSLRLLEVPGELCRGDSRDSLRVGTCYRASERSCYFAPGEALSLEIVTPNGRRLNGASTVPTHAVLPPRLSVRDGRCRLEPETSYLMRWDRAGYHWGYIVEAELTGLPRALWNHSDPLFLRTSWMASSWRSGKVFPRLLTEGAVHRAARNAARRLETGLPWGVTTRLASAAVDRNWANWIRPGKYVLNGEVRVPSVFGDGTGLFGTATRWTVTMESRYAYEETGVQDCGLLATN